MTNKRIKVTSKSIKNAIQKDSHRCMIADAIQAQIPTAKYIIVDTQSIRYSDTKTGKRHIFLTPPEAQREIIKWDMGKPVKPFEFTISQGITRKMSSHKMDNTKPEREKNRVKDRSKRKKNVMPMVEREFGLRMFSK